MENNNSKTALFLTPKKWIGLDYSGFLAVDWLCGSD